MAQTKTKGTGGEGQREATVRALGKAAAELSLDALKLARLAQEVVADQGKDRG